MIMGPSPQTPVVGETVQSSVDRRLGTGILVDIDAAQPPVLLVHGFASSHQSNWVRNGWVDLLVDAGRDTYGTDLLGHGCAPKPTNPEAYHAVEELVQQHRADVPVVDAIGFSAGADILLTLISRHPDSFRRVVLLGIGDAALGPNADRVDQGRAMRDASDWLVERADNPSALRAFLQRPRPADRLRRLGDITARVHVVIGTADHGYPSDALVAAIPGCTVTAIPGLDHFATPGDVRVVGATLDFLANGMPTKEGAARP